MPDNCHFLGLPVELRKHIYELYFDQQRTVENPATWDGVGCGPWHDKQPPITRVNRQIRHESLPTFYAHCSFFVWGICSPCAPEYASGWMLPNEVEHHSIQSSSCQCIAHMCYKRESCQREYGGLKPWNWLSTIGPYNLSHIRKLELWLQGDALVSHIGYSIVVHQDARTKELTIDTENSYWQDDTGLRARKIEGTSSAGNARIEEISSALAALARDTPDKKGLTLQRIFCILDISHRHSFVKHRDWRDCTTYGPLHNVRRP